MENETKTNYRGKVLAQLINLRDANKGKDKVVEGYVSHIIDDVMEGWKKEEVTTK
jgi:hypothetical protein